MRMKRKILAVTFSLLFLLPCIAEAADQFFDSNGVRIRYVVAGSGEPIILVHPFAANAEIWEPLVKDLSQNYQLIAMDCRGHGKSEKPHDPKQYGIEMVNDVVRLMDHLGIKKSIIIGYSMGGSIGMKMLTEHPDRIRMAVIGGSLGFTKYESEHNEVPLLGPNLLSGMPLSEAMIASAPPDWPKPGPQQREMMKRMDAGQDSVALGAETVSHEGLWVDDQQRKAITVPTLVIYGGSDHLALYEEAKRRFPNLQFKKIEGAGHGQAMQSPEFLTDIGEFLRHYAYDATTPSH
jgi:pimeloyl-ACP methyl ester carboxylesterase